MVRLDIHIDADSLIRNDCEWLRLCADMPAFAPLHIQNVIPRQQHNSIISIPVRRDLGSFFFPSWLRITSG